MADDDGRPQHGHRHAVLAQQRLDLAARAEVGGEVLVLPAEAAEVDDPLDAGLRGGGAEVPGGLRVLLDEVVAVEGVHQVVGDVDAGQCTPVQARRVGDVAADRARRRPS